MKSQVLCVTRDALVELGLPVQNQSYGIYNINPNDIKLNDFQLLNRKVVDCKKQDNQQYFEIGTLFPQILGYVVILNQYNQILTYSRGKGAEVRLKKRSIGFGGHCDIEDVFFLNNPVIKTSGLTNHHELLQVSIKREIKEELGLDINYANTSVIGLISDETDEVGQVHVGYGLVLHVNSDDPKFQVDLNEISDPRWATMAELKDTVDQYENWSQIIINNCF